MRLRNQSRIKARQQSGGIQVEVMEQQYSGANVTVNDVSIYLDNLKSAMLRSISDVTLVRG